MKQYDKFAMAALRFALGWHLAYMGVWALTSTYDYSWAGSFRCARWLFGDALRAIGDSAAMGAVDACISWGLLIAGILLMLGRLVRPAAIFGVAYFALMYLLNPPHFGHTGESHFLFVDRNVIEIAMLFCVMFCTYRDEKVRRRVTCSHAADSAKNDVLELTDGGNTITV